MASEKEGVEFDKSLQFGEMENPFGEIETPNLAKEQPTSSEKINLDNKFLEYYLK